MINNKLLDNFKTCSYCFGTGTLMTMQSAIHTNTSIRVGDKKITCKHCNGTGLILRREGN